MEGVACQMQTCYCMCMCTDRLGGAGVAGTGIGQSNLVADVHIHGGILAWGRDQYLHSKRRILNKRFKFQSSLALQTSSASAHGRPKPTTSGFCSKLTLLANVTSTASLRLSTAVA